MKKKMITKIDSFKETNDGKDDLVVTDNFLKLISSYQKEEKKSSATMQISVTTRLLKDKMSFVGVRDRRYLCSLLELCENENEKEIIQKQIDARDGAELKFIKIYEPLLVDYVKTFKLRPEQWKETLDEGVAFLISSFAKYNFDSLNLFSTSYLLEMKSFVNNYIQTNFFNRSRSKAQNAVLVENYINKYYTKHSAYPSIEDVIKNVEFKNNGSKNEETLRRYVSDIYNELVCKNNNITSINDKVEAQLNGNSNQKQNEYEELICDESSDGQKRFEIKAAFQTLFVSIEEEKLFSKEDIALYKKLFFKEDGSTDRENILAFVEAISSSTSAYKFIAEKLQITVLKAKEIVFNFIQVLSQNKEKLQQLGDLISNGSICK